MTQVKLVNVSEEQKKDLLKTLEAQITAANTATIETGNHGLKILFLINGGAIVSILALIPALLQSLPRARILNSTSAEQLTFPITFFVLGLLAAFLAFAFSYLASKKGTEDMFNNYADLVLGRDTSPQTLLQRTLGSLTTRLMYVSAGGSVLLFATGCYYTRDSIISVLSY